MIRYKITIEYDGRPFCGWQIQQNSLSVQEVLEQAASKLNGCDTRVSGSGRTDAGVHATGQVAHVDLRETIFERQVPDALNYHLRPHPVAVLSAQVVDPQFEARFDARKRRYRYVIVNRRARLTTQRGLAWQFPEKLDSTLMAQVAKCLLGQHDFSTFRDTECQAKSPIRTLGELDVGRAGDRIEIKCSAQSFLHKQVRSMVGSLVEVGRGHRPSKWLKEILEAKDRTLCGPVAPPDGLYLERVDY